MYLLFNDDYSVSKDTWSSMDEIDDYMQNGPSTAMIDLSVSGESKEEVSELIADFLVDLSNHSFQYLVSCEIQVEDLEDSVIYGTMDGSDVDAVYNAVFDKIDLQ